MQTHTPTLAQLVERRTVVYIRLGFSTDNLFKAIFAMSIYHYMKIKSKQYEVYIYVRPSATI